MEPAKRQSLVSHIPEQEDPWEKHIYWAIDEKEPSIHCHVYLLKANGVFRLTTSPLEKKDLNCSTCWILWYKYSHHGQL